VLPGFGEFVTDIFQANVRITEVVHLVRGHECLAVFLFGGVEGRVDYAIEEGEVL